jgi:FAD-dependent oxidoreductase domain-containing protein 1
MNRKKEFRAHSTTTQDKKNRPKRVDTLIIGGGPVGASTAFHLAKQRIDGDSASGHNDNPSILVVERDTSFQSGSAMYSAGGIRLQFSLEENVRMSLYGIDFLRNIQSALSIVTSSSIPSSPVDVQYVENGYLILASNKAGEQQLRENHALYQKIGCSDMTEVLSPAELARSFPWLNVDDVLLGSLGCSGEGWFDPWAYIQGLNDKNKSLGVQYTTGTVVAATRDPQSRNILSVRIEDRTTKEIYDVEVKTVVNAAGAAADQILNLLLGESRCDENSGTSSTSLSHPFPVRPRKRSIYFFHCAASSDKNNDEGRGDDGDSVIPDMAPLTIDNTGAYFRSEGTKRGTGNFLCGISPPREEDHDCYDRRELENADPHLFERDIWPALYNRVPAFGSIKLQSSWAGLYEYNTVDQNCIIDFHPEMNNVLMINGFSGHGLQHSPAAGRAGAELIDYGNEFETLNLDVFRFDRLLDGGRGPVQEKGIY